LPLPEDNATELRQARVPAGRAGGLFAILHFIKDNKELVATFGSLLTALITAIAWAFAYFATEERVSRLDCTMSSNLLLLQLLPAEINLDALKIEQRKMELARIRGLSQSGDQTVITLNRLEDEIQTLETERTDYNKSYHALLCCPLPLFS
jgi:hypothetical protein